MTNRRRFSIIDAIDDPLLFQPWFKDRSTWAAWFVFLRCLFGLKLADHELALFQECTGRSEPPSVPATEGWLVCGRRSGKSFMLALCSVYLACFFNYRQHLAPGERGTVMVIAADRKQSRVVLRFVRALLLQVPMLRKMVERETAESFDLNNSVTIEVATASYRTTRGYAIVAALLDELAFFRSDDSSANPDTEIIAALRPAMATIPNAMLLCASSPYAQRGALFDAFKRHFGTSAPFDATESKNANKNKPAESLAAPSGATVATDEPRVLVWRAPTRTMNPTVPQSVIDAAMEADPASAAAEYMAQFRTDVETFVARDVVEAAVIQGRYELPRVEGIRYSAFVDPSGGSSDSMTLAITHMQSSRVITDAIRERKAPFSPDDVVKEFSDTLRSYGVTRVVGDRYAAEWPRERFKVHGIEYRVADKTKSDLYLSLLPLLNSQRIELLDHPRLINQLTGLERRTARSGKDSIDHCPGSFDDVCNAVAGAAVIAAQAAAHPSVKPVMPGVFSNGAWWDAPAAPTQRQPSTTELFYQNGGYGGSRWPGSGVTDW
jgi:hypothetical protein